MPGVLLYLQISTYGVELEQHHLSISLVFKNCLLQAQFNNTILVKVTFPDKLASCGLVRMLNINQPSFIQMLPYLLGNYPWNLIKSGLFLLQTQASSSNYK